MTTPIPESRVYRHLQCGTETVISGQAFEVASNPLSDMTRTWCNQCNAFFPVSDYEWSDTGEKISDYYARHSARASQLERFLCSKKFMIVCGITGFLLGTAAGIFLFRNQALWLNLLMGPFGGGLGAFGALAIYVSLGNPIAKRVCGVSDTRLLT
ncbi:MAG: hypothetical protein L0211_17610 [Planctomycetaceae bacterium]|nr:hypothetical protein [Planctomycetaceae bacterium]